MLALNGYTLHRTRRDPQNDWLQITRNMPHGGIDHLAGRSICRHARKSDVVHRAQARPPSHRESHRRDARISKVHDDTRKPVLQRQLKTGRRSPSVKGQENKQHLHELLLPTIDTAGGSASQKPETGINTTPTKTTKSSAHPNERGSGRLDSLSSSAIAKPAKNKAKPKSRNQATAPVNGSVPTELKIPRRTIPARGSENTTKPKMVCTTETAISQRPFQARAGSGMPPVSH